MPNQFFSPDGDLEEYFVTDYWLIDQYIGDQLWTWGNGTNGRLGNAVTTGNISTPITIFAGGTDWKQVSSGSSHAAAIKTDGTLWTWGNSLNGRLGNAVASGNISTPVTTFAGGTNWKQVSSGSLHTAAIKTDGTLWTWGFGTYGRLGSLQNLMLYKSTPVTTFAGGTNWADTATTNPEDLYTLSAGTNYTAAIKTDGTLWVWGNGTNGLLGNASTTDRFTPVTTFTGETNWKQVNAGYRHILAIKTDGTLWAWGNGNQGRLGNAVTTNVSTPVTTFTGGTNWKQVSCAGIFTAAIKTDGTLWTWGDAQSGQLGNATATITTIPTPITTFAGGTNWKQLSCGGLHTSAIKTDGTLWTWGNCLNGRLGNATTTTERSTPITTFAGGTNWKQVSSGNQHAAAIKTDGTLWTWGNGASGRLGNTVITGNISTPVTIFTGGTDWKQVSAGNQHTAAIKTDGTLWTWGNGTYGRLGNAATTNVSTPVTTSAGGTNWKQVSVGSEHTVALRDDGVNKELFIWGNESIGQLGNASVDNVSTPVTTFAGGTNWQQVSAGNQHTAAIKTDGTLWTWGYGSDGRLGNADITNRFTPVTTFAGGTNWKQVIAGGSPAAIKTDGTLWIWGSGSAGRLGNAVTTNVSTPITTFAGGTNWKQVSAGNQHTAAVQSGISAEYPLS